ncbi:PTS system oligo-beta-mannoside-specific EIIC component [uncultured Clostridium sp.]|uniref:Permease IIC component n=1 Tax=Paeniclostridium hominis TaxID=2764329 RepID=A0ABR7K345_9FIRM|nr:PTS cellobiose transporter subunit IIC [Paeniclostridium hominis]MBC8632357.1 PTS cellobiose transporter subunit IIC [[Eubacterium] tenue]SCI72444.1 PTS system oligo-beta-mannoside-specific EIIC component [uncultured Clostridium sp.]SCI86259.1 PTS system oligo-beta-mannoside-specific EIIC component [uncultured Clostridium sp.]
MNKFMSTLEKMLMPMAEKIGKNKYLVAIRDGFLVSSPLLIVGSFFLLIANFPIPGWNEFWAKFFGENWASGLAHVTASTFDVMTILAIIGIAFSFAKQIKADAIQAAAVALVAFFIITPFKIPYTPEGMDVVYEVGGIPLGWMGSKGMFVGMITSFVSVAIFQWVVNRGWTIKMPEGVPPTVSKSFAALIPSAIIMIIFFSIKTGFELTPYGNIHEFIYKFLQMPLLKLGNTLTATVISYIFLHLFWFFGINGSSVVGAVYNPILKLLSAENLEAFQAGKEIPNIITGQFQDMFATFGGGGSTLSLLIVMLLVCKSKRIKELAKLSFLPGVFGINEPIIFGLPIMLNPILLIPFMFVPMFNQIVTYFCMDNGLVPLTNGVQIPWTTPIIFSGFLVSGWQASVLQVLLLIVGCFMYMPFIKMLDKQYLSEEQNNVEEEDDLSFEDLEF